MEQFSAFFQNVTVYSSDRFDRDLFSIGVIFAACVALAVYAGIKERQRRKKLLEELESPYEPEPTLLTKAEVISKSAEHKYEGGILYGKRVTIYYVTFRKEDGSTVEFTVSESMYKKLELHEKGTLVTADGTMLDFYKDEETEG